MTNCSPSPELEIRQRLAQAEARRRGLVVAIPTGEPLPGAELDWRNWLRRHFPVVCDRPFGRRHERLWEWFESLKKGSAPPPAVEIWPRGGAKSTTVELGITRSCVKLSRRYFLYVSETQEQADKHVASIATFMLRCGVERAINTYGAAKGWRRQELRTANGFNVSALGLDTAARGVKLDECRPDAIVFDDLDNQHDPVKTVDRKISSITSSILPTGSPDCAYLFVQNLIHEEGVFAQLADGRADFLHSRAPAYLEPAVHGLTYVAEDRGDGLRRYRVTGGTPTWAGQDLATVERQINEWGLKSFLREAQHEVRGGTGYVFDTAQFQRCKPSEVPELVSICLAWDLAATEGAGDWTVGVLLGKAKNGKYYVLAVIRGQWASHRVKACIAKANTYYKALFPRLKLHLPQDGGQAGKDQADQFKDAFPGASVESVTGPKAARARGFAEQVNLGNVVLVDQDLPEWLTESLPGLGKPLLESRSFAVWQLAFRECLRKFKDHLRDQQDDDVDAGADAFNELAPAVGVVRSVKRAPTSAGLRW